MQAVSGAGYPGVPSLDILGNVIPYIGEEEEKVERELPKMLGRWDGTAFQPADRLRERARQSRAGRAWPHGVPLDHLADASTVAEAVEALGRVARRCRRRADFRRRRSGPLMSSDGRHASATASRRLCGAAG